MTHQTEIKVNGNSVGVEISFTSIDTRLDFCSHDLEYRINNITLLEDEDEYIENTGGDGTSKEYNDILDAIERGEGHSEALEKLSTEYEEYSLLNI